MEKTYKINAEIYSEDLIENAIIDFKEVSKIKYWKGNLSILGENDLEIDEIFNEFSNYIIWLFNEQ